MTSSAECQITFDIGVLLGLAGLNTHDGDVAFCSPVQQRGTDVFRAVVHTNGIRLSPSLAPHTSPQQVVDEHLDALDKSDWNRLMDG